MKSLLIKSPWATGALALLMVFTVVGCQSDADHIRATNEASGANTVTVTPISAEIHTADIQEGDCIDSTLPEGISIETVVIVVCSGPWQYRALNSFLVDDHDGYPGEDYFTQRAYERCDRRYSYFLYPLAESWPLGYRTVDCLQQSFGLSVADPTKLDRLVSLESLSPRECFNNAPETGDLLVELVSCFGQWDLRVLNTFDVSDSIDYPGEDVFGRLAYDRCDRRNSFWFFPSEETWAYGDRTIICLQDSFGLSASNPGKLDRLVSVESLSTRECFNDAPETGDLLVELGPVHTNATHRL